MRQGPITGPKRARPEMVGLKRAQLGLGISVETWRAGREDRLILALGRTTPTLRTTLLIATAALVLIQPVHLLDVLRYAEDATFPGVLLDPLAGIGIGPGRGRVRCGGRARHVPTGPPASVDEGWVNAFWRFSPARLSVAGRCRHGVQEPLGEVTRLERYRYSSAGPMTRPVRSAPRRRRASVVSTTARSILASATNSAS